MKTWSDWPVKAQREEALRIGDNPDVLRYLDRLYLVVETGHKLTVLVDCPVQKDALYYLYDHYDETGRFYVIFKAVHEDGPHYVLVLKKNGTSMEVFSRPTWSPDKSRFVAGHCGSGPGTMSIVASTPDGLRTEATFTLPCDMGHCELSWENSSTVQAVCGNGFRKLRVTRSEALWSADPRSDPGSFMPRP